ncbi:EutN/CcmL family microcompartment protein [Kolteria novifilia]
MEVVGKVSFSKTHPSLKGKRWVLATPLNLAALAEKEEPKADQLVVIDELGSQRGDVIAVSEGGEAAFPYYPNYKPVDAYAACLIERIDLDDDEVDRLLAQQ